MFKRQTAHEQGSNMAFSQQTLISSCTLRQRQKPDSLLRRLAAVTEQLAGHGQKRHHPFYEEKTETGFPIP